MKKVMGALEIRPTNEKFAECVAVFLNIPSEALRRVIHTDTISRDIFETIPEVRTRGLPLNVSKRAKDFWGEYCGLGEPPFFLRLSEMRVTAQIDRSKQLCGDECLTGLISIMQAWEDEMHGEVRLIIWGEEVTVGV